MGRLWAYSWVSVISNSTSTVGLVRIVGVNNATIRARQPLTVKKYAKTEFVLWYKEYILLKKRFCDRTSRKKLQVQKSITVGLEKE